MTVNHILPTTTLLHNLCHFNMCLQLIISGFWSYGYDTSNYTISRPFTKKKYNKLIDKSFAESLDALFYIRFVNSWTIQSFLDKSMQIKALCKLCHINVKFPARKRPCTYSISPTELQVETQWKFFLRLKSFNRQIHTLLSLHLYSSTHVNQSSFSL